MSEKNRHHHRHHHHHRPRVQTRLLFVTPDATSEVSPSVDRALFFQRFCGPQRGTGTCEPLVRGRARQSREGHRLSCNKRGCRLMTGPQCRGRVGNAQCARHGPGTPEPCADNLTSIGMFPKGKPKKTVKKVSHQESAPLSAEELVGSVLWPP